MTIKLKKRILYISAFFYAISFFLPAIYLYPDTLYGLYCAIWVVFGFIIDLDGASIQTLIFDVFLMLPNFLMILSFFFHKKFPRFLKYIFSLIVFTSAGYWVFSFGDALNSNLQVGYWMWLISSTSFMLMTAMLSEKKVD